MNIMTDGTKDLFFSRGSLLFSNDTHDDNPHCYVEIIHNGDTVNFEMTVGRDINECKYDGYKVGRLLIYNPKVFKPYNRAVINGNDTLAAVLLPGVNEHYSSFDFTKLSV